MEYCEWVYGTHKETGEEWECGMPATVAALIRNRHIEAWVATLPEAGPIEDSDPAFYCARHFAALTTAEGGIHATRPDIPRADDMWVHRTWEVTPTILNELLDLNARRTGGHQ